MQKYTDYVISSVGSPVQAASATVYLTGTTTKATIYSDNGTTVASNPVNTDSAGKFSFYAADGRYDIKLEKSGFIISTLTDVLLDDQDTASTISFTPTGGISANNVQAALVELDGEKAATGHNHDATYAPISVVGALSAYQTSNDAAVAAKLATATFTAYQSSNDSAVAAKADSATLTAHTGATAAHGATGAVVGTTNTQTLTNKTLTAPVISTISNTGTLTLPTSTDTLVGRATTDTLSNKTFSDRVLCTGTGGVGYSTGAGGSVTQVTSKSTPVTLNKTSGQITMHNQSLNGSGGVVQFLLSNSTISAADTVIVNVNFNGNYEASVAQVGNGSCALQVKNISAGPLSDAVVLNFAVIKGATS